jgi:hypothetical protein
MVRTKAAVLPVPDCDCAIMLVGLGTPGQNMFMRLGGGGGMLTVLEVEEEGHALES